METISKTRLNLFKKIAAKVDKTYIVYDLETSSLSTDTAEILTFSAIKATKDTQTSLSLKICPQKDVDPKALEVNGLKLTELKHFPTIDKVIDQIIVFFDCDCIVNTFNGDTYDNILLARICKDLGKPNPLDGKISFDSLPLAKRHFNCKLGNCYLMYCNKEIKDAHTSDGDIIATAEIFLKQLEREEKSPEEILKEREKEMVERSPMVYTNDKGELILGFTKHKGERVIDLDSGLVGWINKQHFVKPEIKKQINAARSTDKN